MEGEKEGPAHMLLNFKFSSELPSNQSKKGFMAIYIITMMKKNKVLTDPVHKENKDFLDWILEVIIQRENFTGDTMPPAIFQMQ